MVETFGFGCYRFFIRDKTGISGRCVGFLHRCVFLIRLRSFNFTLTSFQTSHTNISFSVFKHSSYFSSLLSSFRDSSLLRLKHYPLGIISTSCRILSFKSNNGIFTTNFDALVNFVKADQLRRSSPVLFIYDRIIIVWDISRKQWSINVFLRNLPWHQGYLFRDLVILQAVISSMISHNFSVKFFDAHGETCKFDIWAFSKEVPW